MGEVGQDIPSEITLLLSSIQQQHACTMAASALVVYDHITTAAQEVQLIWARRLNSVTLLFHLNRWLIFAWAVYTPLNLFIPITTLTRCMPMDNFQSALSISLIIVWAVFSTIRVYAISGGNWWISATVCALSMVPAATNLYTHYVIGWFEIGTIPVLGTICVTGLTLSESAEIGFILGTRICAILVDIIVLVATWHRTYGLKKEAMRLDVDAPLATMLLQDGTMYFLGLLVLNSVQIAGWITNDFTVIAQYFITPLTSIITSHFLMDLRSIAVAPPANDAQLDSDNITQRSTIRFSSFVDNMGERLDGASKETEPELEWIAVDDVSLGDPSRLEDVEEVLHQISS